MRVLVTGGSGFIGTNLVEHFIAKGDHILNIDTTSPRNQMRRTYWWELDLLDAAGLLNVVAPHVEVHWVTLLRALLPARLDEALYAMQNSIVNRYRPLEIRKIGIFK